MIDQAAVGLAGRTVRCSRCKASWFAGGPQAATDAPAAADNVIAEAEAPSAPAAHIKAPQPPAAAAPPPQPAQAAADVGAENSESITAAEPKALLVEQPPPPESTPAPADAQAPEPEPATISDAPPLVPPIEHAALPEAADAEQIPKRRKARPKVLTPAASGCRSAASSRAARRAGPRSFSC